jgi:hypothetical protein
MTSEIRYFRLDDGSDQAGVICSTAENSDHKHDEQDFWTEVKVVPLNAMVVRRPGRVAVQPQAEAIVQSALSISGPVTGDVLERAEELAAIILEAVEFLREYPPVNEAQVKALGDLIDELQSGGKAYYEDPRELARDLAERGVRVGDA